MMRPLVFVLLFWVSAAEAQTGRLPVEIPRTTLKFNAFPLMSSTKQGLIVTGDFRVSPRIAVDGGMGWYFNSPLLAGHEGEHYRGIGLRAGAQYYFRKKRDQKLFYLGLEGKYNFIRHLAYREAFRQGQQYVQILPVHRKVINSGVAIRAGFPTYFGRKKQFIVEPVFGLGVQFFDVQRDLPYDAELVVPDRPLFTFEIEPGDTRLADVYFGLWLGVALW